MKIGYQGIVGSNSENATIQYIKKNNLKIKTNIEMIPLISSIDCVKSLLNREVDYIVVAYKNSLCGKVIETIDAIQGQKLLLVDEISLPVHHYLFKKKGVDINNISTIVSHYQALKQTKFYRKKLFNYCGELEDKDTALSAKKLADNLYPPTYAVICSKKAGEIYNLDLIDSKIEDNKNNITTFHIYKLL